MGYFRFFYYIAYIFNTICRIIKRHGKQILWIFCIFGFLIFCMWPSTSKAYTGDVDYSYSDPNVAVLNRYNDVCLDFIRRADYILNTYPSYDYRVENINSLKSMLSSGKSLYIYYVPSTNDYGQSMVDGYVLRNQQMYAITYFTSSYMVRSSTAIENYEGIETPVDSFYLSQSNDNFKSLHLYYANDGYRIDSLTNIEVGVTYYIPRMLFFYTSPYIYEYFINDKSLEEIEQLYAINNSLDTITNDDITTETENTVESAIEDIPETFDNDFTEDIKDNEDTLLDTILTPIYTYADGTTTRRISFTLPFVNYTYQLRGDAISSRIRNTNIYTYIQLFWWFAFSIPIFILLRRIVVWLGTGEFLNKPSRFAVYMSDFISKNITPGMM